MCPSIITHLLEVNDCLLSQISPIILIVFNMIIVRVGMASDKVVSGQSTQQTTLPSPPSYREQRNGGGNFPLARMRDRDAYEMKSIAVKITQSRETDADGLSITGRDAENS